MNICLSTRLFPICIYIISSTHRLLLCSIALFRDCTCKWCSYSTLSYYVLVVRASSGATSVCVDICIYVCVMHTCACLYNLHAASFAAAALYRCYCCFFLSGVMRTGDDTLVAKTAGYVCMRQTYRSSSSSSSSRGRPHRSSSGSRGRRVKGACVLSIKPSLEETRDEKAEKVCLLRALACSWMQQERPSCPFQTNTESTEIEEP